MIPTRAVLRRNPLRRLDVGTFPSPGVLPFAVLLWLGLFVFMVALTFAIDRWGTVESSIWAQADQPVRWGVLFLGVWVVQSYLAAYVAHGVTRRSFAQRTAVFAVVLALLVAGLGVVGFVVEGWIFDLRDWPQEIDGEHLFDDPDDLATIFGNYFMVFLLWAAVGVMNAAAFYRHDGGWSVVSIPLTIVLVLVAEVALDGSYPPFVTRVAGFLDEATTLVGIALWAACLAVAVGMTWSLLRDIPIRPKGS